MDFEPNFDDLDIPHKLVDIPKILHETMTTTFKENVFRAIDLALSYKKLFKKKEDELIAEILEYNLENKIQAVANSIYLRLPEKYDLSESDYEECIDVLCEFVSHCALSECFIQRSITFKIKNDDEKYDFLSDVIDNIMENYDQFKYRVSGNKDKTQLKLTLKAL